MGLFSFIAEVISMGKKRRGQHTALTLTPLIKSLQEAAVAASGALGHVVPDAGTAGWASAKKKNGHHSKKAFCASCGAMVVIMPLGNTQAPSGSEANRLPGMKGDALFYRCVAPGRVPTQLLLNA